MAVRKFPDLNQLDWSSTKTISFDTQVQKTGSGKVRTMTNQLLPNWTIETKFAHLTDAEYRVMLGFVALVKGGFEPFLWLDPEDYQEKGIQLPVTKTVGVYQAVMKMGAHTEPVEYIDQVTVYVDGVQQKENAYSVSGGLISFNEIPSTGAVITADYRYWWKVRFKDDGIGIERIFTNINRSKTFKLEVVR